MCGIIAIVRKPGIGTVPSAAGLCSDLADAVEAFDPTAGELDTALLALASTMKSVDSALRGVTGVVALITDPQAADGIGVVLDAATGKLVDTEDRIEREVVGGAVLERRNAALVVAKDACWAIAQDRLPTARKAGLLAGPSAPVSALAAATSIQEALSAIDRLEVRGRDSAGLQVLVTGHELDFADPGVQSMLGERAVDPLYRNGSVRVLDDAIAFVYKAAAEIGELGDNTMALRSAIAADELLRRAVGSPEAEAVVLGHTRWASVGIISQPNSHPLNSDEPRRLDAPYVAAVLNGDVDNFADLSARDALEILPEITTDAKVIPTLTSRALASGQPLDEAFRSTVRDLQGSVAIGAHAATDPGRLLFALRGSGQALYVGLCDEAFVVASEPYGLVELTDRYLRMDGETPSNPDDPAGSRGQIIELVADRAGTLEGIRRRSYDGSELPVTEAELSHAEITTRDIDRGDFPHFLLKEITESPVSFRKTLRGRLGSDDDGRLRALVGDETLPPQLRSDLATGAIDEILVIGQGTAAIAGRAAAAAIGDLLGDRDITVRSLPATELSGFQLEADMSNVLVVAISQSGTTTDTNRTVDLVRARGARVVAIVNRRGSDLVDKADGVLYTADGRDVEMSVASTKAFYSQVAAGFILADAIAGEVGVEDGDERHALLTALSQMPVAMEATLARRPEIADAARRFAPARRYWAIVGNGPNLVAANEIRIKLSELCYKAIACDATEDKKHIDLSSEPLILVCAAGVTGSTADDVAKEVAIFRAHKAAPIVVADEGADRFSAALAVITVPQTHPALGFILATVAGHLFGYEAALAIDEQARPLRECRSAIEGIVESGVTDAATVLSRLPGLLTEPASRFFDVLRAGSYNGHLEASTAQNIATALRYTLGISPLDTYQLERGKLGTPSAVIEDLTAALTSGIEELTRPVDAIKHQAKTVTVGISRSDEGLLTVPLVAETLAAGAGRDRFSYRTLRTLASLDPAVETVTGFTRYRIEGEVSDGAQTVVVDRGGISVGLPSRADIQSALRGTKHRAATEREVMVAKGRSDGRTVLIVPEVKDTEPVGITLLHVNFVDQLPVDTMRSVLEGYRGRYSALEDAVTETEPTFREDLLGTLPVVDLLADPVYVLADQWRS
ncbi:MAG: SIS domain-containing protein [Acidimicrobiales bacterium]